jgi:hypothetical protein
VLENAGHGGSIAAPVAGAVLRYYFSKTDDGCQTAAKFGVLCKPKEPVVVPVDSGSGRDTLGQSG